MFARLVLEKFNAALAQGNGYLYAFVSEYEILRARQEVGNDPKVPEAFIRVFDSLAHRFGVEMSQPTNVISVTTIVPSQNLR